MHYGQMFHEIGMKRKSYFLKARNILVPTKMATAADIVPITINCSKLSVIMNIIPTTAFLQSTI